MSDVGQSRRITFPAVVSGPRKHPDDIPTSLNHKFTRVSLIIIFD